MNTQAQFLTITPEQLKQFEVDKTNIQDSLMRMQIAFDQLVELFTVLEDSSEVKEDWSATRILKLSGMGMSICENWSEVVSNLQNQVRKLSPLETVKA